MVDLFEDLAHRILLAVVVALAAQLAADLRVVVGDYAMSVAMLMLRLCVAAVDARDADAVGTEAVVDVLEQLLAVGGARALVVVQIDAAVVDAVAAVESKLLGDVELRVAAQSEELGGEGVIAIGQRRKGGHMLAVSPPEVPAIVRILVLRSTGTVAYKITI